MTVYLPDELYQEIKARKLSASKLLQLAVRARFERPDLVVETDRYLTELLNDVGAPTAAQMAWAEAMVQDPA